MNLIMSVTFHPAWLLGVKMVSVRICESVLSIREHNIHIDCLAIHKVPGKGNLYAAAVHVSCYGDRKLQDRTLPYNYKSYRLHIFLILPQKFNTLGFIVFHFLTKGGSAFISAQQAFS